MWIAVLCIERGTVPAVPLELVLALVHCELEPLNSGSSDVRIAATQVQLFLAESGVRLAHCASGHQQAVLQVSTANPAQHENLTSSHSIWVPNDAEHLISLCTMQHILISHASKVTGHE